MAARLPSPQLRPFSSNSKARAGALLLLVLCLAASPGARALGLAEAERIAIERDAMLRQLEAESTAMRQRAVAEGQLMDPKLRLGAVNVPVDSFSLDAEDMTMLELGLSQEFQPGRTRELTRRRVEQSAAAMDAAGGDRRRTVQREVRRAWAELAYLARARELLASQADWVEQMRGAARARYAAGEGKQLEVLRSIDNPVS